MANTHLQSLLQKEVSRKEFLSIMVLGLGSILGFGTVIKLLTGKSFEGHKVIGSLEGYNGGTYGGKK